MLALSRVRFAALARRGGGRLSLKQTKYKQSTS